MTFHFEVDFDVQLPIGNEIYHETTSFFEDESTLENFQYPVSLGRNDLSNIRSPVRISTKLSPIKIPSVNGWWVHSSTIKDHQEQVFLQWSWAMKIQENPTNGIQIRNEFKQGLKNEMASVVSEHEGQGFALRKNWLREFGDVLQRNFSQVFNDDFVGVNKKL